MDFRWIVLVLLLILLAWNIYGLLRPYKEGYSNKREEYIQRFMKKDHRMFPFRYFTDENNKPLPFVAVTGPFRGKDAEDRYHEYVKNGIHIFGITAYKSFPNRELFDKSEGEYERTDTFDYTNKIRDWLCCFKNKENYGFTSWNRTVDISESDFYNAEKESSVKKPMIFFIFVIRIRTVVPWMAGTP